MSGVLTTLPAVDSPSSTATSMTVYTNDLVATVTTGTTTRAYGLDATGRIASWADTTGGTTGVTSRNHYDDTSDSPAWTDNGDNTWTRTVDSISGNLALTVTGTTTGPTTTTGALVDQHGDIVATVANTTGTTTVTTTAYTEYGTQADGTTQPRYGWLDGKHRPTETTTGLILMGVRLYNTTTGRFLQTDPIPGGSAGPYLYPTNPVTGFDLTGEKWWRGAVFMALGAVAMLSCGALCVAVGWGLAAYGTYRAYRAASRHHYREAAWELVGVASFGYGRYVVKGSKFASSSARAWRARARNLRTRHGSTHRRLIQRAQHYERKVHRYRRWQRRNDWVGYGHWAGSSVHDARSW